MKKAYYGLLTFSIMSLSYDLYYWKMRSAVGALRTVDKVLCLSSGGICILIIMYIVIKGKIESRISSILIHQTGKLAPQK